MYWFKDGQPVHASSRIQLSVERDVHSIEIMEVKREDMGEYSAYISNVAGSAYSSARLIVLSMFDGEIKQKTDDLSVKSFLAEDEIVSDLVNIFIFVTGPGEIMPKDKKGNLVFIFVHLKLEQWYSVLENGTFFLCIGLFLLRL